MRPARLVIVVFAAATLAGCSGYERDITLRDLRTFDRQPEEFAIVPNRPLELPETLGTLPQPVPGGPNRGDINPKADAVAALGGNPNATVARSAGVPASDAGLVQTASRFGRDGDIRATLASEDEDFRRRRSLFTWSIVPRDDYVRVYDSQRLDPYRWQRRYREAGALVPAAPAR